MIELNTFSAMELRRDGGEVRPVLNQPKRLALLLYLRLAAPGGFIARERLLGLFWPEADTARARNALRQSLHFLRKAVGDDVVISRGDREVGVDAGRFWCDAVAFDEALVAGRPEDALELYRGDLLPGFYLDDAPDIERWLEDQRARYRMLAARAAWLLSERAEVDGEGSAAVLWARRGVGIEPLEEAGVRRLMELLVATGARAAAVEAYSELSRRLAVEMELDPAPETTALAERVRSQATTAGPASMEQAARPRVAARADADVSRDLYAQLAPRSEWHPPAAPRAAIGAPPPVLPRVRRPRRLVTAAAAIVLLAFSAWQVRGLRNRAAPVTTPPSIAVLPFVNMSDAGNDYFSDGVTEELLNVLARLPGLRVAARTSSFAFRNKDVAIDSIARALRVTHVLEGSVRAAPGRVRITAQLIEAATGYHLWSETYDREIDDIFGVQDEIARAIARRLQVELGSNAWGATANETRDPEAYRLVLRALDAFRSPSEQSYALSATLLEEAIRRDPRYARAYGALANVMVWQMYRHYLPRDSAVYARAESLAARALELGAVPEAHLALARLAELHQWRPDIAEQHFQHALALNPADARTLQYRAIALLRSNRGVEAVASARRATELDPLHFGTWVNYAVVLDGLDRNEEARAALEQARSLAPEELIVLGHLAGQNSKLGRHTEALAHAAHALDHAPPDFYWLHALHAHVLWNSGRRAEARRRFAELEKVAEFPRFLLAAMQEGTGNDEKVLDYLEEAVARREQEVTGIRIEATFKELRREPRFQALLAQMGDR